MIIRKEVNAFGSIMFGSVTAGRNCSFRLFHAVFCNFQLELGTPILRNSVRYSFASDAIAAHRLNHAFAYSTFHAAHNAAAHNAAPYDAARHRAPHDLRHDARHEGAIPRQFPDSW